jgi:hypothetical protein
MRFARAEGVNYKEAMDEVVAVDVVLDEEDAEVIDIDKRDLTVA